MQNTISRYSLVRKIGFFWCHLSLLINNFLPIVYLSPSFTYAQEATPTEVQATIAPSPEPENTSVPTIVEPTEEPTVEPTAEPTTEPIQILEPTAIPTLELSPTATPEASITPQPSVSPQPEPTNQGNNNTNTNESQPTSIPAESPTSSEPTVTVTLLPTSIPPTSIPIDGHVNTTVVESFSCRSDSLNGCLISDKADYSPTDVALITGYGFLPNSQYVLRIISYDEPAIYFEKTIDTNDQGSFTYSYQLDGSYRPNYTVKLSDLSGHILSSTTFTDSHPGTPTTTPTPTPTDKKVTICHSTNSETNPYNQIEVSMNSVAKCQSVNGHGQDSSDIIPSFSNTYCTYPGKNWTTQGQAIWNNGCTVPATKGHLVVQKTTLPANDPTQFVIQATGSGTVTGSAFATISDSTDKDYEVTPGTYSIIETVPAGWTKTGDTCQNKVVTSGQTVTCLITNTRDSGTLRVFKNVDLNGDGDYLDPSETNNSTWKWQYNGSADQTTGAAAISLPTGNYVLTETVKSDYHFENLVCTGGTLTSNSIVINKGANVVCTFINARDTGELKIIKDSQPDDQQNFIFTLKNTNNQTIGTTELDDDNVPDTRPNDHTFTNLVTGVYKVYENSISGWTLDDVICDSEGQWGYSNGYLSVDIISGKKAVCTFVNKKNTGTIELKKVWSGTPSQVTLKIGTQENGSQIDSQQTGINGTGPLTTGQNTVNTGTYYVSETDLSAYGSSLTCFNDTNNNGSKDRNESSVQTDSHHNSVAVGTNQHIICIYTNTRNTGSIKVHKQVDNDADGTFEITSDSSSNNLGFRWGLSSTNSTNTTQFGSSLTLDTGTTSVYEYNLAGYHFAGWFTNDDEHDEDYGDEHDKDKEDGKNKYSCTNLQGTTLPISVSISKGKTTEVTLCNVRDSGKIKIIKNSIGDNGTFNFTQTGLSNFSLTTVSNTAQTIFSDLSTSGSYSVSETDQSGWDLTSSVCDKGTPDNIPVEAGQTTTCTFTNVKRGNLTVIKYHDYNANGVKDEQDSLLGNWDIIATPEIGSAITKITNETGQAEFDLIPGNYNLNETLKPNWYQSAMTCDNQEQIKVSQETTNSGEQITVTPGQNMTCYIGNYQKATITINKNVVDFNGKDFSDNKTFTISGGESLGQKSFSEESPATFVVNPGNYSFSEVELDSKYQQKNITDCEGNTLESSEVTAISGRKYCLSFTNQKIKPVLYIAKYNTTWPNNTNHGSDVEYTITLQVKDSNVKGVVVTDLPPKGFIYKLGSYKVKINNVDKSIPEPQYHSPGKWFIGDLAAGDIVTLTYLANVENSVDPGLYKDIAWAFGCSESSECSMSSSDKLLALSFDSGKLDTGVLASTFVGTKVRLDTNYTTSSEVKVVKEAQNEVLGASTSLPQTGSNTIWLLISALLSIFGLSLVLYSKKTNKKMPILITIFLSLSLLSPKSSLAIQSDNIFVRIENPKSPTNQNKFNLDFVAVDMLGRALTVTCYKKNPDNTIVQLGSPVSIIAGGNSGQCNLDSSPLSENTKTYYFYVVAANGSEIYQSETVSVDYNINNPDSPNDYSRENITNCQNKISFRAANDSRTSKIEVYRSESTTFTADGNTRIAEIGISPDQKGSYTDVVPDCNKTYYYAIRAFDGIGNGSGVSGDSKTITTIVSTATAQASQGAISITGGAGIPEEETTILTPTPVATGSVLGQGESGGASTASGLKRASNFFVSQKWAIFGLGLLFLLISIYAQKKNSEKKSK